MSLLALAALPAILGVASYLAYFRFGEHHFQAPIYVQLLFGSLFGGVVALVRLSGYPIVSALFTTLLMIGSYLFGALASVTLYRVFFSPLSKFPGPWQAKITAVWLFTQLDMKKAPRQHQNLHEKYGRYVRIGPNTLSVSDADAHEVAFGHGTAVRKSHWYDLASPWDSLHTTRDRALHDRRRRVWVPAFSDKALREYEPNVKAFNDKFIRRLREHQGGPVNATKWFNLYAFDVMGRLAFGREYNMLDTGEKHWALQLLTDGMTVVNPRPPIWLFRILLSIPFAAQGYHKFIKFSADEMEWRAEQKDTKGDITGWLFKPYGDGKIPTNDPMLQADSRLIIVAGSDTTATTLTFLFYELAKRPEEVKKLREELRPLTQGEWSHTNIYNSNHLNGCINESLRLWPPVPSGTERKTPPEGSQVGDVYIPGNVNFWMPQYVISRDEEYYQNALDFVPERWYSKPKMIKHKNAFAPFSLGAENCIGKNLAYMEMRTLTAQIILEFDVALAPGEDGTRLMNDTLDHFTVSPAQVDLVFTPISS